MSQALAEAQFTGHPENLQPEHGRRGTLLVVDDEEGPRESLRVIFQDNYEVLLASDGRKAIDLAQQNRIDVALVDIRMAGMSGIDVLERLKFVDSSIEVVMMTAFETADTIRQALRLRACDYINKPFDISTMRAAVANAMHRRTLESELTNNTEQLQQLVEELRQQREAEQISRTRGEIYASIIHDINGPLTVISGFLQLLNQRIGSATRLDEEDLLVVKERLKTITRQVTNCISISRRYLSFLRDRPGELPHVGINELLLDVGHLLRVHPSLQSNDLSVETLPQDIAVRMNGTDLIQALLNLAVNALQSTSRPHAVTIKPTILPGVLDVEELVATPADRVLNRENFDNVPPLLAVTVADDGPGMQPDVLSKIFQPYFTTKAAKQGTGLGLSIVQRLVREAQGLLHVHSQPGAGTQFTLYLQAARVT